jgi:asparagine synthase (glutamine-hydrolysing)
MLMKVDAMSMAHALEARVPFLDRRIMDFAGLLDSRLLSPVRGRTKHVLRAAAACSGVPTEVVEAKKMGFNIPIARLLRTGLASLAEQHLSRESDRLTPFFRGDGLRRMLRDHREGRRNHAYALWALLAFSVWLAKLAEGTKGDGRGKATTPRPGNHP